MSWATLLVGTELEVEGRPHFSESTRRAARALAVGLGAESHRDASLSASGIELVTPPMRIAALRPHLSQLIGRVGRVYKVSRRCGGHIHVDARLGRRGLRGPAYKRVAYLTALTEHEMLRLTPTHRQANCYCAPHTHWISRSPGSLREFRESYDAPRYRAINFALGKSTVEFRLWSGTLCVDKIVNRATLCAAWMTAALTWPEARLEWLAQQPYGTRLKFLPVPRRFRWNCL